MSTRFTAQTVLVTGGGTGIGRAVALAFAKEGAAVAVAGRTAESLAETVKLVEHDGGRAAAFTADVADSGAVIDLIAQVVAGFGALDIAVNNAGTIGAIGPVGDIDENEWDALLRVNLTGTLLSMKQEIAHMRTAGRGVIVNIASTLGAHKRVAGLGAYVTTKAAVSALTRNADALNARIIERGGQPVPMNRFRPNIVVCGWDEPHVEDRVRGLRASDTELGYAKLAARCVVTTVDQDSGSKAGPEPLRTLASYRRAAAGGVAFGVKFAVVQPGKLSMGHELRIISWGKSEL